MKNHRSEQEADAFGSSVNSSCETTRLPAQVKVQVQSQQVIKDVSSYSPNGFLCHTREDSISQLLKQGRPNSSRSIYTCMSGIG